MIESASHATGSLLIWDTGEYEVLPRKRSTPQRTTDDELSDIDTDSKEDDTSQSQRLFEAFRSRHIKLRLHGAKLPRGYTITLRLPSANNKATQPRKPKRKRRRLDPAKVTSSVNVTSSEDELDPETASTMDANEMPSIDDMEAANASEDDEDATVRANNAYSGANNTIGSIHQRHWFLTLDRFNSGFRKARDGRNASRWTGGWDAFYVRGRDHERSVITGRLADDVMSDEGVKKFVGRKMWRPITE